MEDLTFRLAKPDDAAAVDYLVDAAYRKWVPIIGRKPAPMLVDYQALIRQGSVYVATITSVIAGVLVIWPMDDSLYIDNIAVHPDYQRWGIGERLLDYADQKAREAGLSGVSLMTNAKMEYNQHYYRKHGYVETRREPIGDGGQVVWMRKPIG